MRNTTETVPHSVELTLRSNGAASVVSERRDGHWESVSSDEFLDEVQHFASGLLQLGIQKGDTFGIMAASSPRWLIADLGAMAAGCSTVPMFVNIADENLRYQLVDSDLKYIFVEGEEALERIRPFASRFKLVVHAKAGSGNDESVIGFADVIERGKAAAKKDPQLLGCMLEALDPNAVATIIYTSGSTGSPKGVELSHANLLSQIEASGERFPLEGEEDVALSCLPLAHVFERMVVYYYLCSGTPISFVDDIQNVGTCLKEVKPTTITMVPRLLEKVYGRLREGAEQKLLLKRLIARWAIRRAFQESTSREKGWKDRFADKLVYSKFREGLGGNFRRIIAGGAALSPKLHRFFLNIGLPVYQGYGLTEAAPVLTTNFPGHNKIGTVGQAFPGVDLRVSPEGEILARGENVMLGYHHARAATRGVIDERGWLHTGDLGHFDRDGYLVIDGRAKEMLKTSNGKYVSPIPIEQGLCESSLIDMAMVVAEGKPFVSALLFVDPVALESLRGHRDHGKSAEDLMSSRRFLNRVEARVNKVNAGLNEWEQVRAYRCVCGVPSIDKEELTPTMKLKRGVVEEHFHKEINAVYSGHENIMSD
ncbi:AMP-dependent synthetase/ligase [Pelagicoccus mobilis]|uniref:Long-chain fatty acid--CoA ligase n=1 Tax=Pelagicoccus mobilis TaxID=415221 RepID=A0A934S3C4_9BACT|nr:long-chain fatty acid--CoA ligase [Pelagicoccus mobilis]MBK1880334.1 long-chain fatty acid--CoA ligase [Pelagicoccus mobilis]